MSAAATTFIAGHRGLVGSAFMRRFASDPTRRLISCDRTELDLRDAIGVDRFFAAEKPDEVFLAAAKVGGILANINSPADFLLDNLMIQNNVLASAHRHGVRKLLFLGSSCLYPREAMQPIREDSLLAGKLEPTNEPYAIAKVAGITLVKALRTQFGCNFVAVMPTNLYGPFDNFSLESSHVLPALIRRFCDALDARVNVVTLWGTGAARREFLHVDDLADACAIVMRRHDSSDLVNIGAGVDLSIRELAETIADVAGWDGRIEWDPSKPDGMPRKLLNGERMAALGWRPRIALKDGIRATVEWFRAHRASWHRM